MKGVIISEVPGLYQVIQLKPFRRTPGVEFDQFPMSFLEEVDAIDRVIHEGSAISPGPVDGVERPWYMHPNQADNLLVLSGMRHVEVYTPRHGRIESFDVTADEVRHNGKSIAKGGAMLVWPRGVFHRIRSGEGGSASVNIAKHYTGFDIDKNFSIYDVNVETGTFRVIREGHEDQF